MRLRAAVLAVAGVIATASTSVAQTKEPLPRAVADLRATSAGLTTGIGWTPPVPAGTEVPGRALGLEAGAHVYLLRRRLGGLGLGGAILLAGGKTSPPEPVTTGTTPPPPVTTPDVSTRMTSLAPQVSFNFGHRLGFSYLSAGLGRTRVTSTVTPPPSATPPATSPVTTESPWARTLNYGGGARWFFKDHLAFSLELRWYKVSSVTTASGQVLPKQSLLVAAGGISIK